MIYNKPTKADDGMRHVTAFTDEKKRCFIQLPCVKVLDIDSEMEEVSFEITGEENQAKIESVHASSIQSAVENAVEWFGKELHYTGMGSSGDQTLGAQNKTLHESNFNGVEVHLFEVFELREYTYQGIVIYNGKGYQEKQTDIDGNERKVWMFPSTATRRISTAPTMEARRSLECNP